MKMFFATILFLFTGLAFAGPTDQESLYQLNIDLTDQNGNSINLDIYRGQPVLIAMFYARCPHVCPLTIHTIKKMESTLKPKEKEKLRVLLVTLDASDTPQLLTEVGNKQKVDFNRWKFAHTDTASIRKLAAVLGVRFRALPDGEFNHSTLITLLDSNGIPVAKSSQLSQVDMEMTAAISKLLRGG